MTGAIAKDLSVPQGYAFNAASHLPLGFIVHLTIGDNVIAPDVHVVDPVTGQATVVAVLSHVGWPATPVENASLSARISVANAQQLRFLATQPLTRAVVQVGFVAYAFDPVTQVYYPSFKTYVGVAPATSGPTKPGGTGFGSGNIPAIYSLFAPANGIKIGAAPMPDPAGIPNVSLDLALAPVIAAQPQQLLSQTTPTQKTILPWGLPQS